MLLGAVLGQGPKTQAAEEGGAAAMKRGDRVKVPGFVLSVTDGIAEIEFAGTYPENGQRIRIAVEAIDPEDVTDTEAAIREFASSPPRPIKLSRAALEDLRGLGGTR